MNEKHRNMQWKHLSSTSIPCSIKNSCTSQSLKSVWKEVKTRATWTQQERKMHIKELGLLASKLAQKTFFKAEQIKPFNIQIDNIVALTYFLKIEGKRNLQNGLPFQTYFGATMKKKVIVTAEYLPSALNKHSYIEFCRKKILQNGS